MSDLMMALIKSLITNGVKIPAEEPVCLGGDKVSHGNELDTIFNLDFSEHDKKVAEEKDKRIAELEKIIDEKSGGWGKCGLTLSEIIELQDRHQSDCIEINRLHTALEVMTEKYVKLREIHGL